MRLRRQRLLKKSITTTRPATESRDEVTPIEPLTQGRTNKVLRGRAKRADNKCRPAEPEQLTVQEVADICRFHPKTVRGWIKNRELKAIRKGRSIRITRCALKAFLREYRY